MFWSLFVWWETEQWLSVIRLKLIKWRLGYFLMSFNLLFPPLPHRFYHSSLICCKIAHRFCLVPGFAVWKNRGHQVFSAVFVFPWNKHKHNSVLDFIPISFNLPSSTFSAIINLPGREVKRRYTIKDSIFKDKMGTNISYRKRFMSVASAARLN